MRKSLATKLSLSLYLALLPLGLVGVYIGFTIKTSMDLNTEELIKTRRLKELAGLSWGYLLTQEAVTKSILLKPENMNEVSRKIQAHDDNLAVLKSMKSLSVSSEMVALIEQILEVDEKELVPIDTTILETLGAGKADQAKEIYFSKYEPTRARYENLVKKLGESAEAIATIAAKKVTLNNQQSFLNTTFSLLASVLLVGSVIFFLTKRIVKRLDQTVQALREIAEGDGDLTRRLEVNSQDEIGKVAQWFNTFVGKIENTFQAIAQDAQILASSSDIFADVSHRMNSNAEETSAQAGVVLAVAEEVSKNIQTASAGTEEMTASIKEIAKNASDAAKMASNAVQVAEQTNATVSKLGDSGQEIGQVIKVINSIAEQTNLLALNANIEAARAGEAGKGFAVVANEVKELAKQTGKATEDISRKIQAIQGSTKEAVKAIGQIGEVISRINGISNMIACAVEEQSATTMEISCNVAKAAKGAGKITQSVAGVSAAAKSTSSEAADTQNAVAELSRMANDLQALVVKFKYGEHARVMQSSSPGYEQKVPSKGIGAAMHGGVAYSPADSSLEAR